MSINYKDVDILLEKISRMISKYENIPDDEKIKKMISDKLMFDSEMTSQINSGYNTLIELIKEWKSLEVKGENAYYGNLSIEAQAMINVYKMRCEENKKDLQRAKYNLETNNSIFRILDYILNANSNHKSMLQQNSSILKLNCSQFIINYYFEKIRDELIFVMQQDLEKVDSEMHNLCNKYNNNPKIIQLMYEVLIQNFSTIRNEYKPKSRIIGNFLRARGVSGDRNIIPNDSLFILLRNCASHGEFYPDLDTQIVEAINTKNENNQVIKNISFDEIINYAKEISALFNDEKVELFNKLLLSGNILQTIDEIKTAYNNEEILKQFGILLMFNLIQYNNEHYFVRIAENSDTKTYLESVNIKDYFDSSFSKNEKSTYEFMEVIKNALGHMNVELDGSTISFHNKLKNETVSSNIAKMYDFILSSSICDLAMSTNFYVRLRAEKARLLTHLYSNTPIVNKTENLYTKQDYKINDYYINNNKIK